VCQNLKFTPGNRLEARGYTRDRPTVSRNGKNSLGAELVVTIGVTMGNLYNTYGHLDKYID
jgi:hypothetical protein